MDQEFISLQHKQTLCLVPYDATMNVVGRKWVFRVKRHLDGSISCYKALLVAKGFHQQLSVDFVETFSPVVKHTTVQIIFSLAVSHKWPLR